MAIKFRHISLPLMKFDHGNYRASPGDARRNGARV